MNNELDIAIVGMSGRFPGARNVDEFWHNLAGGIESITRFSDQAILDSGVHASYLSNPNYVKAKVNVKRTVELAKLQGVDLGIRTADISRDEIKPVPVETPVSVESVPVEPLMAPVFEIPSEQE